MHELTVGSLFSGIGGIELGFERAGGYRTLWFVENDLHAQAILRKHWPNAEIYADVTYLDFGSVPKVDVLTGGFPCQDISNAGKRAGITGSRSSLWKHCVRAISAIQPRIAVFENVSALTRRGLSTVLCDLAQVGYDAEWHCISASSVGAPHRRDRIFIMAYPNSSGYIHREADELADQGRQSPLSLSLQGGSHDVPNAESIGRGQEITIPTGWDSIGNGSQNIPDAQCTGLERQRTTWTASDSAATERGIWASEPNLGRVADGIPHWMDRIKRLGNAVVPQVAEAVGKAIKEGGELDV